MGLFDLFTGQPAIDAANQNKGLITANQTNLTNANGITQGQNAGLFNTGFANAAGNLGTGYNSATGAINTGAGGALGYLDQGTQGAVGALTQNGGAFAPLSQLGEQYGKGAGLYADALGINGADGNARATAAYQAGPGYQAGLDTGLDALNRRLNASGQLVGGNGDRDAIKFASDYANQSYGSWLDRLSGYNALQSNATQGAAAGNAGINQNVANVLNGAGAAKAGVASGQGGNLASLASQYYGGLAGNDVSQAGALAGNNSQSLANLTGIGNNATSGLAKQNDDAANAQMQGSANLWNFGLQAAKLAAGAAGGGGLGGLGSLGGSGGSSFLPSQAFMQNKWGW